MAWRVPTDRRESKRSRILQTPTLYLILIIVCFNLAASIFLIHLRFQVTFLAESKNKAQKFPDTPFITTPTTVKFLSRPHPIIQPVAAATMSTTVMGFDEQKVGNKSEKSEGTVTRFHKLEFKLPRIFTSAHSERLATKQMVTNREESESRMEAKTKSKMETSTEVVTFATHMSGMQFVLSLSVLLVALAGVSLALECSNCGAAKCADGWTEFQGVCYKLIKNETGFSFTNAQRHCQSLNSSLASIPSSEVNSFLTEFASTDANCTRPQFANALSNCAVWVGLARLVADDRVFFWLDNTNSTYRHWAQAEPSGTDQNCGNLWSGARGNLVGFWDSLHCDSGTTTGVRKAVCAQCPSKCVNCCH
ncbi:lectin c-type domain-containing protein [Ditylenchus destructor]|nr:lectin c-type domain-containing protein [Ditylenchus destructor]